MALATAWIAGHALPSIALDPERATSQYVIARWDTGAGLPSHSLYALLHGRDGYLWLGTSAGLVRFDGARFVLVGSSGTPGFGDGGVTALANAADGTIYFGTTSGGATRYSNGRFSPVPFPPGGEPALVGALLVPSDGSLWIGARSRFIYRHANGTTHSLRGELAAARGSQALLQDGDAIWIGTPDQGLFRYQDGIANRHGSVHGAIQALARAASGALWVATPDGVMRVHGGEHRRYGRAQGLEHPVVALHVDRNGNLWAGTAGGGLYRVNAGGDVSRLTTREGLSDDDVRALAEDREGNLWVATARGLTRVSDGRFVTLGALEGLDDAIVHAVAPGGDGSVWIGGRSGTVARLRGQHLEHYRAAALTGPIVAVHEDRQGRLWLSDNNGRLFRLDGGSLRDATPPGLPKFSKVSAIGEDADGLLLFITGFGLTRLRDGLAAIVQPESEALGYGHFIHRDTAGTLWVGGSGGLLRLRGNEARLFTAQDGLPASRVRSLYEDGDALWLATTGGLARLEGDTIRTVTVNEGLPENYLVWVADDGRGRLWLASRGHVFRLEKKDVDDVLAGRHARVEPLLFDASDGLATTEVPLGSNPGFRDARGRLWLATAKGVSVVDPERLSTHEPAPPALIESMAVDGRTELLPAYPPGRGDVTIDYAALGYGAPHKIRFRYRLHGQDDGWVDAGGRRSAYYSNLPPGSYRFTVMASNRDGLWNGAPAERTFTLLPPFYRRPSFHAAVVALVFTTLVLGYRRRMAAVRTRFTAILDERTRIARELHDTLAQGLAGLGMQLETALKILPQQPSTEAVKRELEQGRSLVRMSLAEVRRSIWVLRAQATSEGADLTSSLPQSLAQLVSGSGARFHFEVEGSPRRVSADLERHLLRIAHEAVTNAAHHARAQAIGTSLRYAENELVLTVRDDGSGFDADEARRRSAGTHFGLLGLAERARSLGGALRLTTRPGAGTEVECRLPYYAPGEHHS